MSAADTAQTEVVGEGVREEAPMPKPSSDVGTILLEDVGVGAALPPAKPDDLTKAWLHVGAAVEAAAPLPPHAVKVFSSHRNLFAEAVHMAFYEHYPLVLTPDVVWIAIAQGFGNHMAENHEALRHRFVDFDGKKELCISRPSFRKGSPENDWTSVFPEFAEKIGENIGKSTKNALMCEYSTTGPVENIVSCVALMDCMQHYFEFVMRCGCGFPSISLRGTAADWEKVRAKAAALGQYDLEWWTKELVPVLDQFVQAAHGAPDLTFWRSLCNFYGGSGIVSGPITGWLQVFFPYINMRGKVLTKNNELGAYRQAMAGEINVTKFYVANMFLGGNGCGTGIKLDNIPPGMSTAPFKYIDDADGGKVYPMVFAGGFTAIVQDPVTRAVEPVVGWAVLDAKPSPT
jgi:hypothetical protein